MRPYSRSARVGGLIKQEMAELLRKEINDPGLVHVTITAVKVSSDLQKSILPHPRERKGWPRPPWRALNGPVDLSSANLPSGSGCAICPISNFIMMIPSTAAPASKN